MSHFLRFVILQSIFAVGIGLLFYFQLIQGAFSGLSFWICSVIAAGLLLGLATALTQRWCDTRWLATHILRLGLLGTVIGLLLAFRAAGGITSPDQIQAQMGGVIHGMYISLWATLFGVGSNLWLKINMRLLGKAHD